MSSIKKTAILITVITLCSKLLGFGREILLAYYYGTSYIVDVYLMAVAIPIMLFGWLSSISFSYIPLYTDIRTNVGENRASDFTNNLISLIFIFSMISSVLGVIFSKQIVSIAAPGFTGDTYDLTVKFFNVIVWSVVFLSTVEILIAYLNCNNKFLLSNLSNLIISSVQMASIFISVLLGKEILIYGALFSHVIHLIVLIVISKNNGLNYKIEIKRTSEIDRAFIMVIPIFVSSMTSQINIFVDKMFASKLIEGSISALNYSSILRQFLSFMFSIAITTMIFPMLSQSIAENNIVKLKEITSKSINIIIILFVPLTIGAILLAEPAITFVYERGEFMQSSTIMTTKAFMMYSIGLLPIALSEVVTKVFYSLKDSKSTMYIGMIGVIINIILNTVLIKPLGHVGLALATSLSIMLSLPLFFIILKNKIGNLGLKNSLTIFIKSLISAIIMGIVVYFGYRAFALYIGTGKLQILLNIIITVSLGGIAYFGIMVIMGVEEMKVFINIIIDIKNKLLQKK